MSPIKDEKKRTRSLNAIEKLQAIVRVSVNGETKASVARSLGVPESTLRGWCKNHHKIRHQVRMLCPTEGNWTNWSHEEIENVPKRIKLEASRDISYASNSLFSDQMILSGQIKLPNISPPGNDHLAIVEKRDQIYQYQEHLRQQAFHSFTLNQELTRERETENEIIQEDEPKNVQKHGSVLDTLPVIQNHLNQTGIENVRIVDPIEAVEHGNRFLKWLEECNSPDVTTSQLKTVQSLMKNLKNAFEQRGLIKKE